jgi:hypothetical protein
MELPTISDDLRQETDRQIIENEIAQPVKELNNGKSPGTDGLGIEFYKFFWTKIHNILCQSIEFAIENGKMSIDQIKTWSFISNPEEV